MSLDLLDWDSVRKSEIDRLAKRDAALGIVPILIMVEPSGDMRVVSPFHYRATADLLRAVVQGLLLKGMQ